MSSSPSLDSFLAGLVSSYNETTAPVVVAPRKVSKPRAKLTRVERSSSTGTPTTKAALVALVALPPLGSLDAAGFLLALRDAGKIVKANDAGVMIRLTDSIKEKADQIQAIGAFVGYDFGTPHGVQLDKARNAAQSRLYPAKADSAVAVTVKGFVAGMPNGTERAAKDLIGRIRLATETKLDAEKAATLATEKNGADSAEAATHLMTARLEGERIEQMTRDLRAIVGQ